MPPKEDTVVSINSRIKSDSTDIEKAIVLRSIMPHTRKTGCTFNGWEGTSGNAIETASLMNRIGTVDVVPFEQVYGAECRLTSSQRPNR